MDPNELYGPIFDESTGFKTGLGISYNERIINKQAKSGMIIPVNRALDGIVHSLGSRSLPIRLQVLLKNDGCFHIVPFAGEPLSTVTKVLSLRKYLDTSPTSIFELHSQSDSRPITIMVGKGDEGQARLGCPSFGNFHFGPDHSIYTAHGGTRYDEGVIVFGPDGLIGYATLLDS